MTFWSPGENAVPLAELNSLGAPFIAVNWPLCPITRMCVPPSDEGSSNRTVCPALIVTLVLPLKLNRPKLIVAAALTPLVAVAAGVSVGAVVAVALEPPPVGLEDAAPHAASMNATQSNNRPAILRMEKPAFHSIEADGGAGAHLYRAGYPRPFNLSEKYGMVLQADGKQGLGGHFSDFQIAIAKLTGYVVWLIKRH